MFSLLLAISLVGRSSSTSSNMIFPVSDSLDASKVFLVKSAIKYCSVRISSFIFIKIFFFGSTPWFENPCIFFAFAAHLRVWILSWKSCAKLDWKNFLVLHKRRRRRRRSFGGHEYFSQYQANLAVPLTCSAGEILATRYVLLLPPRDSRRSHVSAELRYDTNRPFDLDRFVITCTTSQIQSNYILHWCPFFLNKPQFLTPRNSINYDTA